MGHHYIPQFYLRGFAVDDVIWAYDKLTGRAFQTQVKSIANETGMYSDELESRLANEVEDPAKPAIAKARARAHLSQSDRLALSKYIVTLWKRVPRARERIRQHVPTVANEVHAGLRNAIDTVVAEHPELAERAYDLREQVAQIIARATQNPPPELWYHSIQSHTLNSRDGPNIVDALLSMNWVFLCSDNYQFLTSDNPVFFFERDGIGKENSELTVPLSNSLALWATRTIRPSGTYLRASPAGVREINRRVASISTRFLYAHRNEPWILPFATQARWRLTRLR